MYYFFWQYLNDVEELENWINDKMALATSKDYGKDENSADKLLTKNKVGTIKWREIYVYRYWKVIQPDIWQYLLRPIQIMVDCN